MHIHNICKEINLSNTLPLALTLSLPILLARPYFDLTISMIPRPPCTMGNVITSHATFATAKVLSHSNQRKLINLHSCLMMTWRISNKLPCTVLWREELDLLPLLFLQMMSPKHEFLLYSKQHRSNWQLC